MEALLAIGLWNAVGATLLALVATGASRVCRRPAVLHALWLLVLLKLLTPPLWSVAVPISEADFAPTVMDEARPMPRQFMPLPANQVLSERTLDQEDQPAPAVEIRSVIHAAPEVNFGPDGEPQPDWEWPWLETVLLLWAGGALLCWSLSAWRVVCFHQMLRQLCPAPQELQERVRGLAAAFGLQRTPVVCLVAAPISPMVWALTGRARLLVPQSLWDGLSAEQRDLLVAHELAHLRRHDHLVRLLELVAVGLYWWFPVAWGARRRLQEAAEICCDAYVVAAFPKAAAAYAAMLVESASYLSRAALPAPAGASGLGPVPLLRRRITMILGDNLPVRLSWTGLALILAAAAILLPLWPTRAEQQGNENNPTEQADTPAVEHGENKSADGDESQKDLHSARLRERTGESNDNSDIELVEKLLIARRDYQRTLELLHSHYIKEGDHERAKWAEDELREYHRINHQAYRLDLDVPPPTLHASTNIHDANKLLTRAMEFKQKAVAMDYIDNQRRSELLLQQLLRQYPTSDKIGQAAYLLGDLYESPAFEQFRRAAIYFERCFQWSPAASVDARIRAARLYDIKLNDRTHAIELYKEITTHETDPNVLKEANKRLTELRGIR